MSRTLLTVALYFVIAHSYDPGAQARAECIVGDPNQTPIVTITSSPPDCCYDGWAGDVIGTVNNVVVDSIKIVLYAQTNLYWVQPYDTEPNTYPNCEGEWSNATHGGRHYCAILCKRSWDPPPTLGYLPAIGDDILAIDCAPIGPRTIQFEGYSWYVKSNGDIRVDPGPNYFSDSAENVWTDDLGRLHLRLTNRASTWYCPEVYTESYFGYGRFVFTIEGPIDTVDPNVVVAGFIYDDVNREVDIEFSRWARPEDPNGQYVVHPWDIPGNRHRFDFSLSGDTSTHEFSWTRESVRFVSYQGEEGGEVIQEWTYAGSDVPAAGGMRMRFNVWLVGGVDPEYDQEVEFVISAFRWEPLGTTVLPATWGRIKQMYR